MQPMSSLQANSIDLHINILIQFIIKVNDLKDVKYNKVEI